VPWAKPTRLVGQAEGEEPELPHAHEPRRIMRAGGSLSPARLLPIVQHQVIRGTPFRPAIDRHSSHPPHCSRPSSSRPRFSSTGNLSSPSARLSILDSSLSHLLSIASARALAERSGDLATTQTVSVRAVESLVDGEYVDESKETMMMRSSSLSLIGAEAPPEPMVQPSPILDLPNLKKTRKHGKSRKEAQK
jgi:hypothetical protein